MQAIGSLWVCSLIYWPPLQMMEGARRYKVRCVVLPAVTDAVELLYIKIDGVWMWKQSRP